MTNTSDSTFRAIGKQTLSTRLARTFKAFPVLTDVMRLVLALTQPRFTAGVVGVVHNEQREILIVEHAFHPRNAWGLPGGWLGPRERPLLGLKRELIEELELEVEIVRPLLVDTGYYLKSHLDIAFLCRAQGDVGRLSFELVSYRWTSLQAMPQLFPFHQQAVEAAQTVYQEE